MRSRLVHKEVVVSVGGGRRASGWRCGGMQVRSGGGIHFLVGLWCLWGQGGARRVNSGEVRRGGGLG
jgi:hypothetical protein